MNANINGIRRRLTQHVWRPLRYSFKAATLPALIRLGLRGARNRFNRILDDTARIEYAGTIRRLAELAPEVVARKIPRANIQQAFVFDTVQRFSSTIANPRILCVGSHEDSAAAALKKTGHAIEEIDPVVNGLDLNSFCQRPTTRGGSYDIVFSTSVLEHVKDDALFVKQVADLLAPGGVAILTCDFKPDYRPGDPVIASDERFYTKTDLLERILGPRTDVSLVDAPTWDCPAPDFELGGFRYTFATVVFRKSSETDFGVHWDRLSAEEQARYYDEHGFLVVPSALSATDVAEAIRQIGDFGLKGTTEDIWKAPFAAPLVTNAKLLAALRSIFGPDIRFFKGAYVESPPENSGSARPLRKALHVDYGIGEPEGDMRNSAASWVNVAFYLTDLTREHAPLWVVPGSNRSYRNAPASNFEGLADRARMVLARAGDAVLFHGNTVHAASHNFSSETRHALFYSYRPAWAKHVGPVPEWSDDFVRGFPAEHRGLFRNLNVGL